jgi:colanic acid biosynthesis glycosyl transferase WcaI
VKILLLNQAFYPDVASTAQHASDLAAALADRGHDVTVVCSRRLYDSPNERLLKRETWRSVRIRRISSFGFGKAARWRRAADFGSYLANCLVHLTLLPRFDLVVAMTSPPLISWLAALFVRLKGGRFLFWVMDLNPDEALAAGWLRKDSWTTKCLEAMLGYSLRQAESIVALDRFMAKRIEKKGISLDKMRVLPPWSHDNMVQYDPEGRSRFRDQYQLHGKFIVMYSGNHSPCHPLTTLLEAARKLTGHDEIVFCFVGGGAEFGAVRNFAQRHELRNIITIPYQPLDKLSASLSSADLHLVVMGDAYVGIVHPCKVYNIRTLGIPYLYIGPSQSHIGEMNPAFTAQHGDVDRVVRHIQEAARSSFAAVIPGDVTEHSQDYLVGQMVQAIEGLSVPQTQIRRKVWQSESEY